MPRKGENEERWLWVPRLIELLAVVGRWEGPWFGKRDNKLHFRQVLLQGLKVNPIEIFRRQ